jgi:hypothetical protein
MGPANKDAPWNPGQIIENYQQLLRLGNTPQREALEGFLLALRLSQPLRLPPGGKWPKRMVLRFANKDL